MKPLNLHSKSWNKRQKTLQLKFSEQKTLEHEPGTLFKVVAFTPSFHFNHESLCQPPWEASSLTTYMTTTPKAIHHLRSISNNVFNTWNNIGWVIYGESFVMMTFICDHHFCVCSWLQSSSENRFVIAIDTPLTTIAFTSSHQAPLNCSTHKSSSNSSNFVSLKTFVSTSRKWKTFGSFYSRAMTEAVLWPT